MSHRLAVAIGVIWVLALPSLSAATEIKIKSFVGLSDKRSTKVKRCANGASETYAFSNTTALNVELNITVTTISTTDKRFNAFVRIGVPTRPLVSGTILMIEKTDGIETYQLVPSGDLTTLSLDADEWDLEEIRNLDLNSNVTGLEKLLGFINEEAGCACGESPTGESPSCEYAAYPTRIFPALTDVVTGTLVVDTNASGEVSCPESYGSCHKANVKLVVRAFMDDGTDGWGSKRNDLVQFQYSAQGYVVVDN